jgi:hypothetical protein
LVSVPPSLLAASVRDGRAAPRWLDERDHPWLVELIDTCEALCGERHARLAELVARQTRPERVLALRVVAKALGRRVAAAVPPVEVRATLFGCAAGRMPREVALARAARSLGVEPDEAEAALFADLPDERRLGAPAEPLAPQRVALQCNLAIAQALLACSTAVTIELDGHARAVVRHARLRGLICTLRPAEGGRVVLDVSGPLSLFRHTALYGRHLAELVPLLAWSRAFRLVARCVVRGAPCELRLDPRDPIRPAAEPRRYDSRLERRFARDFRRLAVDWELVREPEPVAAGGTLVFPDFAIWRCADPDRRVLVELVGFWTADYVAQKLRRLRAASIERLVLCIDEARACADDELPPGAAVVRFRGHVDAGAVLACAERLLLGQR